MNEDVNSQRAKARDVVAAGKRLRRQSTQDDDTFVQDKIDGLKNQTDNVAKQSAERMSLLEQAVPLAQHFSETHEELLTWFKDVEKEVELLQDPAVNTEAIKNQQDELKVRKSLRWNKFSI